MQLFMWICANQLRSGLFMNHVELLFLYFLIAGSFRVSLVTDTVSVIRGDLFTQDAIITMFMFQQLANRFVLDLYVISKCTIRYQCKTVLLQTCIVYFIDLINF